jgi:hypothetical protein
MTLPARLQYPINTLWFRVGTHTTCNAPETLPVSPIGAARTNESVLAGHARILGSRSLGNGYQTDADVLSISH